MDIANWLQGLGLGQYESAFVENAIDVDILPDLSEGDLEKLGIPLGHRKRLVRAIRAMGSPAAGGNGELAASQKTAPGPAERRHLTVMICDLVGSTALSARLD